MLLVRWSGRRESNSPGPRWQRGASPVGFVRVVRELGDDPSPLGWKPSVQPSTPHARNCSWRLHSPFRLGRSVTLPYRTGNLVELLRRRGRGAPPRAKSYRRESNPHAPHTKRCFEPSNESLVEMLGNAPSALACKARAQPSAHPLGTEPANRTLFSGLGNRLPTMGCSAFVPRTGNAPVSTRLDKPPSTLADPRGIRARGESRTRNLPLRKRLLVRSSCSSIGVTYGFRSRQGHVHSVPGSPAPSRHSQRGRNRTCMTSVPSRVDSQYPTRWCTPSVSSRPLRCFKPALSPDQLEVPASAPCGYRARLVGLKDRRPHLKSKGASSWRVESNHPDPRYE